MRINPSKGLQALETVMSSTATTSPVHGVGTFVWAALMRSQARLANPLFAEFQSDVGKARRVQSADAVGAPASTKAPVQNVLQDVLHILHNVLGRAVDTGEPLMEVPLKDSACILGLLSAAVERSRPLKSFLLD